MHDHAAFRNGGSPIHGVLSCDAFTLADVWRNLQVAQALDQRRSSFRYRREWEYRVEGDTATLLDELAESPDLIVHRVSEGILLMQSECALVEVWALRVPESPRAVKVEVAATDRMAGEQLASRVRTRLEPMQAHLKGGFLLDWHHRDAWGALQTTTFHETVREVLRDEAYPDLADGVEAFIRGYLDAPAPVLVLQGPPGTGKTQLIRGILSRLAQRHPGSGQPCVLYASDPAVLQSDDYFIRFRDRGAVAMVIEDADHFLAPRVDGNAYMHRFLNASDGLLRAGQRKVILSTNLPGRADIDEALLRPGRCHAHLRLRALSAEEVGRLMHALGRVNEHPMGGTLAEIYRRG